MFSIILGRFSLKSILLFIVACACIICAVIAIVGFNYFNRQELYSGIINKSRAIHLRLEAATDFVANQQGLEPVVERMKTKYKAANEISKEDKEVIMKQVPIFSAMKIGAKDSDKDGYEFIVFSDEPRREGNKANDFQLSIFKKFEKDPALTEHVENNGETISVYRPVRLKKEQGCFTCHGDPATSPWGDGKDILGYKMENWTDGKLHGVFEIRTNIKKVVQLNEAGKFFTPAVSLISLIVLGCLVAIVFSIFIVKMPVENLNKVVTDLAGSANNVDKASGLITSTAEKLSEASTEQASSLQETSSSIEEINSMVLTTTENAKKAMGLTEESLQTTFQGKGVVEKMVMAMDSIHKSNDEIKNESDETFSKMEEVIKIIDEINSKTTVINDIVFQTKLLSFNASVEAARAGEHGKGFSVVAEEVGNLAAMSGKSAVEISELLEQSKKTVEKLILESKRKMMNNLEEGAENVERGSMIAKECSLVFEKIVEASTNVSNVMREISNASFEQSKGVSEVTKAITELNLVTHQNSTTAVETSELARELSSQSEQLKNVMLKLDELIQGKNS